MKPKLALSAIIILTIAAAVLPARLKADRLDPGPPQTVILVADEWGARGILVTISSSSPGAPVFPNYSYSHPNDDQLVQYAEADAYLRSLGFRRTGDTDMWRAVYIK